MAACPPAGHLPSGQAPPHPRPPAGCSLISTTSRRWPRPWGRRCPAGSASPALSADSAAAQDAAGHDFAPTATDRASRATPPSPDPGGTPAATSPRSAGVTSATSACPPPPHAPAAPAPAWPPWPPRPPVGGSVSGLGPVAAAAAIADHLPRHRCRRPPPSLGDHGAGVARRQTTGDLFSLRQQQGPSCPTRRWALAPAGLQHHGAHRRSRLPNRRATSPSDSPAATAATPRPARPPTAPRTHDHLQPPDRSEVMHSPMETATV
jgi:hypothetical protein